MQNINKMDRNGNEIDKALDEALNVLHRKSELAEDELRDRMKDDVWRELCADLAECERVVTEDECRANHDVDKLWNQFKEQMEKGGTETISSHFSLGGWLHWAGGIYLSNLLSVGTNILAVER